MLANIQHTCSVSSHGADLTSSPSLLPLITDASISDAEFRVLMYLMSISEHGAVICTHRSVGDALGKSERTVRRALRHMDRTQHVETEHRGWHRPNCYHVWADNSGRTAVAASSSQNEKTLSLKGKNADEGPNHRRDGALDAARVAEARNHTRKSDWNDEGAHRAHGNVDGEPREELQLLISRNPANDTEHTLKIITKTLERGGCGGAWSEYLERIRRVTTAPERCGAGHYVARAKEMAEKARLEIRKPLQLAVIASPRCGVCSGGMIGQDYCNCQLGRDLRRVEAKRSKAT